ncbi:MAG: ribbon-helix-helix protein, CopG family [Methanocella sp.]
MSYKAQDSRTSKPLVRKRPAATMTVSSLLLEELDDLKRRTGLSRSQIIEKTIAFGLERFRKEAVLEQKASLEQKKDESVEARYMREVLFGSRFDQNWQMNDS